MRAVPEIQDRRPDQQHANNWKAINSSATGEPAIPRKNVLRFQIFVLCEREVQIHFFAGRASAYVR